MSRTPFTFQDLTRECKVQFEYHQLDGQALGVCIHVPDELRQQYPFNASAYAFLQQLRREILEFGTIEFPDLPVNKSNYTLAQGAPLEHAYSSNPYMTDTCQQPHQDTPPYPTAFWLPAPRQYFSTWLMSTTGVNDFMEFSRRHPHLGMEDLHAVLVPRSLDKRSAVLVNRNPGLILIDNSDAHSLYHARTCNFSAINKNPDYKNDTPMYAYNEIGLLHYIDSMDSRRGQAHKDASELAQIKAFMAQEKNFP